MNKSITVTFKYNPKNNGLADASKFLNMIMGSVYNYNVNSKNGYVPFEFVAAYVDPDDMSINEQNEQNNMYKIENPQDIIPTNDCYGE